MQVVLELLVMVNTCIEFVDQSPMEAILEGIEHVITTLDVLRSILEVVPLLHHDIVAIMKRIHEHHNMPGMNKSWRSTISFSNTFLIYSSSEH